uniref:Uncharacterized protein n=1 Tax=Anguilla anguilla TaxID=7936 RepID=A0A0E9RY72_ANGAN
MLCNGCEWLILLLHCVSVYGCIPWLVSNYIVPVTTLASRPAWWNRIRPASSKEER